MSYASNQELIDRVGNQAAAELTTDSGSTPDQATVTAIIGTAEGTVNSYLSRRYAVPVDVAAYPNAAGILRGLTLDIGVFRMKTRRPPVPEADELVYKQALVLLKEYADGTTNLPAATTPESTAANDPMIVTGSDKPRFD